VEECLEANSNCFCGAVGSGPSVEDGFDVAYARLDEKRVFFKYGSELGRDILFKLGLKPASEREVGEYREKIESTRESTSRAFRKVMREVQENLLKKAGDRDLWLKVSDDCVGCGNCNFVCPTCFCLEFEYSINEENMGVKTALWTGCLLYTYGQVAGGHFRRELYTRYRHFLLHKFVFYPRQTGLLGCVGCGRCITWCPMGIDLRKSVNSVARGGVNEGGGE
jgi:ferredoxin